MGSSPFSLAWLKLWRLIYAFAFTGWLPVHALGWVTKLGSRTLTNYMLYKLPSILVGKVGACYLMNGLGVGAFWVVAYAAMPFITALLCSEVVTFALWPIILPRAWEACSSDTRRRGPGQQFPLLAHGISCWLPSRYGTSATTVPAWKRITGHQTGGAKSPERVRSSRRVNLPH